MKTEFLSIGLIEGNSKAFERLPCRDVGKTALGAPKATRKRREAMVCHKTATFILHTCKYYVRITIYVNQGK